MTLVLNPNARKLKMDALSVEDFRKLLPPNSEIHLTRDLDELNLLMSNWKHGERTLCFFGGDGSISRGITSLIRNHGEEMVLPPVLAVRAGTINMLCNVTGKREGAQKTLDRWFAGEQAHELREIPTLRIQVNDDPAHYGFVFVWGVGYRVLTEYYRRNESPNVMDAAAVASQTFLQAMSPFNDTLPIFRRDEIHLRVNGGEPVGAPMHNLAAGTIERLSLGIRPFPPGEIKPGGFHFSANGMPLGKVAMHSPSLIFGMNDQRELDFGDRLVCGSQVRELECDLTDGFTLDGELFDLPAVSRVHLSAGPVVRFWTRG
ncbi:hypothetical protein WDW37_11365 [Bdellovibrionota bacterium FG-1]